MFFFDKFLVIFDIPLEFINYIAFTLIIYWLFLTFDFYIGFRQRRVLKNTLVPPQELKGFITQEKFDKARSYNLDKINFSLAENFFYAIITTIIISNKMIFHFWNSIEKLFSPLGVNKDSEILHSSLFIIFGIIILLLLDLPWKIYEVFWLESKYGFNNQTVSFFIKEIIKLLILSIILSVIIFDLLIIIIKNGGNYFFLFAWIFCCLSTVILMFIYPEFIAPLFDKFTPVPEGDLKTEIEKLAHLVNFPLKKIFIVEGSKRSSHSNAYLYGFQQNKRIVLFDTLIYNYNKNKNNNNDNNNNNNNNNTDQDNNNNNDDNNDNTTTNNNNINNNNNNNNNENNDNINNKDNDNNNNKNKDNDNNNNKNDDLNNIENSNNNFNINYSDKDKNKNINKQDSKEKTGEEENNKETDPHKHNEEETYEEKHNDKGTDKEKHGENENELEGENENYNYQVFRKGCTTEEIVAILSHELGHWELNHFIKNFIASQINLFLLMYFFAIFYSQKKMYFDFGFTSTQPVIIGLLIAFNFVLSPYQKFVEILFNCMSRKIEYQADRYAVSLEKGKQLKLALIIISLDNLSFPVNDWLYSTCKFSHPSLLERLRYIEENIKLKVKHPALIKNK